MKTRYIWTVLGFGFSVTLAVIVGQRLSAEAMAVMVGVVAGVAASIPTSLIVVWVVTRTAMPRSMLEASAPRETERSESRIVVVAPPQPAPSLLAGYQNYAGYPQTAYSNSAAPPALVPRRFTVIGGADASLMDEPQEAIWQR